MSTNTSIHVGFWTNWTEGSVSGSTLTLSNRNGAILIAALAIFIQVYATIIFLRKSWLLTAPTTASRWKVMDNHIFYRPSDQNYQGTKGCYVPPATGDSTKQQFRSQRHMAIYKNRVGLAI